MENTQVSIPLIQELYWLQEAIRTRLDLFTGTSSEFEELPFLLPPDLENEDHPYANFVKESGLTTEERFLLMLSFTPHIHPGLLEQLFADYIKADGVYPEIGGIRGEKSRNFLPTGETALFILSGFNIEERLKSELLFSSESPLFKGQILNMEGVARGESRFSGKLILNNEYIELFKTGGTSRPTLSTQFPAEYISTSLAWSDLVLPQSTMQQVEELQRWIRHHHTLMNDWGMGGKIKPGYTSMFYGPPGTGKTLTATLLGKATGKDVFRIDLSTVVSKYIGETEQNLARLFDRAENKNWILFFDEADALFGKRTDVRDAHDKYANQEVSYLLQRIETFNGLTILASNFKDNIDDAFTRRFQSLIYFPMPKAAERLLLWKKAFPSQVDTNQIDFNQLANQFELTGANIMNIVQFACLQILDMETTILSPELLRKAIFREYGKEGKLI